MTKLSSSKKDWLTGLLILFIFILLSGTESLKKLELWGYSAAMHLSPLREPYKDIVIVNTRLKTDEETPGDALLKLLRYLDKAGAGSIGLVFQPETAYSQKITQVLQTFTKDHAKTLGNRNLKQFNRLKLQLDTEGQISKALRRAGNVILNSEYSLATDTSVDNSPSLKDRLARALSITPVILPGTVTPPSKTLSQSAQGIGLSPAKTLSVEHHLMPALLLNYQGKWLPGFELALIRQQLRLKSPVQTQESVRIGDQFIASPPTFRVLPYFYIFDTKEPAFKTVSIDDVLENNVPRAVFKRKIILVGPTTDEIKNINGTVRHVPAGFLKIPADGSMPTVTAKAHIISSILQHDIYRYSILGESSRYLGLLLVGLYLIIILPRLGTASGAATTALLFIVGANIQWLPMAIQHVWIPSMLPLLALLCGYLLQTCINIVCERFENLHKQLSTTNLQLAQNLQNQGQFDKAFEHYQKCLPGKELLASLYNLGLDYERKRQFNKAIKVFNYIGNHQKNYKDIREHIKQNKTHAKVMALGGNNRNKPSGTLVLSDSEIEKPMLGRYQIEKVIGNGAMGTVYLGNDPKINRTVAIKTLTISHEDDEHLFEENRKRFFREAETAGRLSHPNIVTIHDVGEEQDLAYIAMDFLAGAPLSEFIKPQKLLPLIEVVDIAIQVADALDYAHENKVVHRDIKPANMIYDRKSKQCTLTDFGVAHLADMNSTKTGTVLGTPYYMSPEQLAAHKVDGRSDIFSLGTTLYQLFTGELPFTGDNLTNLMYTITHKKQKDIKSKRPELPVCIRTIVNRCLQKKEEKRYQNGEQLVKALKNCRKHL